MAAHRKPSFLAIGSHHPMLDFQLATLAQDIADLGSYRRAVVRVDPLGEIDLAGNRLLADREDLALGALLGSHQLVGEQVPIPGHYPGSPLGQPQPTFILA